MRARRLRPSFESLDLRIAPTDPGIPLPMPGSDTTVLNNLGTWQVGGDPQCSTGTLQPAPVDTTNWVVVAP